MALTRHTSCLVSSFCVMVFVNNDKKKNLTMELQFLDVMLDFCPAWFFNGPWRGHHSSFTKQKALPTHELQSWISILDIIPLFLMNCSASWPHRETNTMTSQLSQRRQYLTYRPHVVRRRDSKTSHNVTTNVVEHCTHCSPYI